jgi:plasmid stabilization system protein ParE
MTYQVIVEPSADQGIREAIRWITRNHSPQAAARWFNGLEKKVATLSRLPFRCPVAVETDKFPEEIREFIHGPRKKKYRILFTVRGNFVHVLYVRHAAQDELEP